MEGAEHATDGGIGPRNEFVAPNPEHSPTLSPELFGDPQIATPSPLKFLPPELAICCREFAMTDAVVPEARIKENGNLLPRKSQINLVPPVVELWTTAVRPKELEERDFPRRVLASDSPHDFAAFRGSEHIGRHHWRAGSWASYAMRS